MRSFFQWLMDLLFPTKCMLCGKLMDDYREIVCRKCLDNLPEWDVSPRKVGGYIGCAVPFFYEEPIRGAILRFKFHGMRSYGEQFAQWMANRIWTELAGQYDFLTWVPCSRRRRHTRGFDQTEVLAKCLAKELSCPVYPVLKKIRNNPKQSTLSDAARRRANVLGVYRVVDPERVNGARILVVDDVVTTGATLEECSKMLTLAGAKDLVCTAIASARMDHKK